MVRFQTLFPLYLFLCCSGLIAQSDIPGVAPVTLEVLSPDCNGRTVVVSVQIDLSGLNGVGGPAGLNAFVLAFDLDRSNVFASALPGSDPDQSWRLTVTDDSLIDLSHRLIVVGHAADTNAPNQNYQVLELRFSGSSGPLLLSLDAAASSLGSRVVANDGPGPIALSGPSPLELTIPLDFELNLNTALPLWREEDPDYDLDPETPEVDIRDLTHLIHCGG